MATIRRFKKQKTEQELHRERLERIGAGLATGLTLVGSGLIPTPAASSKVGQVASRIAGVGEAQAAASPVTIVSTHLPTGKVGQSYSGTIIASGGSGMIGYVYQGGNLAEYGLNFQYGDVAGTPTKGGIASFTIKAEDANDPSNFITQSFTITIESDVVANTVTGVNIPSEVTEGQNYTATFNTARPLAAGEVIYFSFTGPSGGGEFTQANNSQTYTAPEAQDRVNGDLYTLTAARINDGQSMPLNRQMRVRPAVTQVQITNPGGAGATTPGSTRTIWFRATGGSGSYSWSMSGPNWMTISQDGDVTATIPTDQPVGPVSGTVTVRDTGNTSNTATTAFTLNVQAPAVSQVAIQTLANPSGNIQRETNLNGSYRATGGSGAGYDWSMTGPSWITIDQTGLLTGTVPTDASSQPAGPISVTVTAKDRSDANNQASTGFTVTVVNSTITVSLAGAPSGDFHPGGTVTVRFQASGLPAGTAYLWGMSQTPGMNIDQNGTVTVNIPAAAHGGDVLSFSVWAVDPADSTNNGSTQSSITVQAPTVSPLNISTASLPDATAGTPYSATISAEGGQTPYTWSSTDIGSGLSVGADGRITGTPTIPAIMLGGGIEQFHVTVTDSQGMQKTATLSIRINPQGTVANSVTGVNLPAEVTEGQQYTAIFHTARALAADEYIKFSFTGPLGGDTYSQASNSQNYTAPQAQDRVNGDMYTLVSAQVWNAQGAVGSATALGQQMRVKPAQGSVNITISPASLPDAEVGKPYNQTLIAASSIANIFSWQVLSSDLADFGLSAGRGDTITGTPTKAGSAHLNVRAFDANNPANFTDKNYTITVNQSPTAGNAITGVDIPTEVTEGQTYVATFSTSKTLANDEYIKFSFTGPSGGDTYIQYDNTHVYLAPPAVDRVNGDLYTVTTAQVWNAQGAVGSATNLNRQMRVKPRPASNQLRVTSIAMPLATVGQPYSAQLEAEGGNPANYRWLGTTALRDYGLNIDVSGKITGTPNEMSLTVPNPKYFDVVVTDGNEVVSGTVAIQFAPSTTANRVTGLDIPAEVTEDTTYTATFHTTNPLAAGEFIVFTFTGPQGNDTFTQQGNSHTYTAPKAQDRVNGDLYTMISAQVYNEQGRTGSPTTLNQQMRVRPQPQAATYAASLSTNRVAIGGSYSIILTKNGQPAANQPLTVNYYQRLANNQIGMSGSYEAATDASGKITYSIPNDSKWIGDWGILLNVGSWNSPVMHLIVTARDVDPPPPPPPPPVVVISTMSGKVTNKANGQPLAGVAVFDHNHTVSTGNVYTGGGNNNQTPSSARFSVDTWSTISFVYQQDKYLKITGTGFTNEIKLNMSEAGTFDPIWVKADGTEAIFHITWDRTNWQINQDKEPAGDFSLTMIAFQGAMASPADNIVLVAPSGSTDYDPDTAVRNYLNNLPTGGGGGAGGGGAAYSSGGPTTYENHPGQGTLKVGMTNAAGEVVFDQEFVSYLTSVFGAGRVSITNGMRTINLPNNTTNIPGGLELRYEYQTTKETKTPTFTITQTTAILNISHAMTLTPVGTAPVVTSVVPNRVERGKTHHITVNGANLGKIGFVTQPGSMTLVPGSLRATDNKVEFDLSVGPQAALTTHNLTLMEVLDTAGTIGRTVTAQIEVIDGTTNTAPSVTSASPSQVQRGKTTRVTLQGANLSNVTQISQLLFPGQTTANAQITSDSIHITSNSQIEFDATVAADAELASKGMILTTSDGQSARFDLQVIASTVTTVQNVTIEANTGTVTVGGTLQLTATVTMSDGTTNSQVAWETSNPVVATVDATGKVTGVAVGNATITARSIQDGTKFATTGIVVNPVTGAPTITSITPSQAPRGRSTHIIINGTNLGTIGRIAFPDANTGSDEIKISPLGLLVTPTKVEFDAAVGNSVTLGSHSFTLTELFDNGNVGQTVTGQIQIIEPSDTIVDRVTVSPGLVNDLKIGQTQQFTGTVYLVGGASNNLVVWQSSNPNIVAINTQTGLATAVAPGEATITAISSQNPDKSGTAKVTVTQTGTIQIQSTAPREVEKGKTTHVIITGENLGAVASVNESHNFLSITGLAATATKVEFDVVVDGSAPVGNFNFFLQSPAEQKLFTLDIIEPGTSRPSISTVTPNSAPQAAATHVEIVGTNLAGAQVSISGVLVTIQNLTVSADGTRANFDVAVANNAPLGQRTLTITTPNGSTSTNFIIRAYEGSSTGAAIGNGGGGGTTASRTVSMIETTASTLQVAVGQTNFNLTARVKYSDGTFSNKIRATVVNTNLATATVEQSSGRIAVLGKAAGTTDILVAADEDTGKTATVRLTVGQGTQVGTNAPTILQINPWAVNRGATTVVGVTGTNLQNAQITLDGSGAAITNIVINPNGQYLGFNLTVSGDATTGYRAIHITTANGTANEQINILGPSGPTNETPPPAATGQQYVVKKGDSLWKLSKKFYGDSKYWGRIFDANRAKIRTAHWIYPGQVLVIP